MIPSVISLGLSRITALLHALFPSSTPTATPTPTSSQPSLPFTIIHVAGTNGKGSVIAYLSHLLLQNQSTYTSIGRFHSPHFISPNDAIRINNIPIPLPEYTSARSHIKTISTTLSINCTPFELTTATAFYLFAQHRVECVILEVGMGGLLDATNVFHPDNLLISVITNIGFDHVQFLGTTIPEIASHKAGIIKYRKPVIIGPQTHQEALDVFVSKAHELDCEFVVVEKAIYTDPITRNHASVELQFPGYEIPFIYPLPLPGDIQLENSSTALTTFHYLLTHGLIAPKSLHALTTTISETRWPGRLDFVPWNLISPSNTSSFLCDGAHNPASSSQLNTFIQSHLKTHPHITSITFVFAFSKGKDIKAILSNLLTNLNHIKTECFAVPFANVEEMPWVESESTELIQQTIQEMFNIPTQRISSIKTVLEQLATRNDQNALVVVTGSLYLIAQVYREFGIPFY